MMVITITDRMTLVDGYSHSDDVVIHIVLKPLVVWSTMNLLTRNVIITITDITTLVDSYSYSDDVVIHIVLKSLVVWSTMKLQTTNDGHYHNNY